MFPLTGDAAQIDVIADVEFTEWELSGAVEPLADLTPEELDFLLSYLAGQVAEPEGLAHAVQEAVGGWVAELEGERAARQGEPGFGRA
jgi:hypothetical protein